MQTSRSQMAMVVRCFCLLSLLALVATPALAQGNDTIAQQWLDRMAWAAEAISFEGRVVYTQGERVETMHVVRSVGRNGVTEKVATLNGPKREILREPDRITCLLPEERSILVDHRAAEPVLRSIGAAGLRRARDRYDIAVAGSNRIAEYPATELLLTPRDQYRYGMKLWLERESGLMLGYALIDEHGQTVERLLFAQLDIAEPIADGDLMLSQQSEGFERLESPLLALADGLPTQLATMPPGFEVVQRRITAQSEKGSQHWIVSDGLASVSIYVEPASTTPVVDQLTKVGAVSVIGSQAGEQQLIVMGEVPPITVRQIADAMSAYLSNTGS